MFVERVIDSGTRQPSVAPLNQIFLTWDFYRDITDDRESNVDHERMSLQRSIRAARGDPSGTNRDLVLKEPPSEFQSAEEYIETFLPLFLIECKQGISRAKEMDMTALSEVVIQCQAVPKDKNSVSLTFDRADTASERFSNGDLVLLYLDEPEPDCEYYLSNIRQQMMEELGWEPDQSDEPSDDRTKFRDEELVDEPLTEPNDQSKAERIKLTDKDNLLFARGPDPRLDNPIHILGVVENAARGQVTIKVCIFTPDEDADSKILENIEERDGSESNPEIAKKRRLLMRFIRRRDEYRLQQISLHISKQNEAWYLSKVMNMITLHREFQALMSLPDMILKDHILMKDKKGVDFEHMIQEMNLGPKAAATFRRRAERRALDEERNRLVVPTSLNETLQAMYNESQMSALNNCLKAEGITLIQGPPGTGKTTTIVGILSVILNSTVRDTSADQLTGKRRLLRKEAQETGTGESPEELEQRLYKECQRDSSPWLYKPDFKHPWDEHRKIHPEHLENPAEMATANITDAYVEVYKTGGKKAPKRILVCAPSNAAIDEILKRLTNDPARGGGIFDADGKRYNPQVIRIGPNSHEDLRAYSLSERVQKKLQGSGNLTQQSQDAVKMSLLAEAKIVCSTLSVTGCRELTTFAEGFDTVVVDEASQGVEMASLIPLKLQCSRLVLVGDPKQLPATVFSRVANELGYSNSLFQRLEKAGMKVNMLAVQYRMHPNISRFPSVTFYSGNLLDAPDILKSTIPPLPYYDIPLFKPVVMMNLVSEESIEATSYVNKEEVDFICQLVDLLRGFLPYLESYGQTWTSKIAVISPYAEQVKLLRKQLKMLLGVRDGNMCPIDVNTVDGFQGREKDLVIFSAVRAQYTSGAKDPTKLKAHVGFLADVRRMNVALTRARLNLWVVANGSYLAGNPQWGEFWTYSKSQKAVFDVDFTKHNKEGYLKHWLFNYFQRNPEASHMFEPCGNFLHRIADDVKTLTSINRARAAQQRQVDEDAELENILPAIPKS